MWSAFFIMIIKEEKGILIKDTHFNPQHVLECGQVFRYTCDNGEYSVFSADKFATVAKVSDGYYVSTDSPDYFFNYFDLDTDYDKIVSHVSQISPIMQSATQYGYGIRILKQDFYETLFSFIISANNNIKRIQLIIERLCNQLGKTTPHGKAFPTVEALASVDADFYRSIGAGYRSQYLADTAKKVHNGYDFTFSSTAEISSKLCKLLGVGQKVADCVMLFSLMRKDVFPVDTWIKKVYHAYFEDGRRDNEIRQRLIEIFGEYSGYAQQYLFYYQRSIF